MTKTRDELQEMTLDELRVRLIQELSEVIKAVTKWQLHGPRPTYEDVQYDNVGDMWREYDQVRAIMSEISRRAP